VSDAGAGSRTRAGFSGWAHPTTRPQVCCRLDYHLATPGVAALARKEQIHLDPRFSDHAPLTVDYDFTL
jgi:exonuclease III